METQIQISAPIEEQSPQERSKLKVFCLIPAVAYDTIFFVGPLLFLVWIGFWTTVDYQAIPGFSLDNYLDIFSQFFTKSKYALGILQSVWVASTTTILALFFCYPFTLVIVFGVPERLQRLVLLLAIAPFWSSYILRLYSWQLILSKNGLINSFLSFLGLEHLKLGIAYTQIATRIGLIHFLLPIMTVILFVVLHNIDRNLIEAARDLGATRWQTFCRVIFPISKLGVVLCASFALIVSFGDALAGVILGGGTGRSIFGPLPLFANMIVSDYASYTNLPRTSALATLMVLLMLLMLIGCFRLGEQAKQEMN